MINLQSMFTCKSQVEDQLAEKLNRCVSEIVSIDAALKSAKDTKEQEYWVKRKTDATVLWNALLSFATQKYAPDSYKNLHFQQAPHYNVVTQTISFKLMNPEDENMFNRIREQALRTTVDALIKTFREGVESAEQETKNKGTLH